ncbi:ATP-binding protein [Haloferula chungangensis]|uniref:histidine kinase n=1 Tax=Haloferula chungangensis TaxID=1048331 RepID=A0ABW2L1M4_9BACT
MNPISIIWPMIAGACLCLAVVHLMVRLHNRQARANSGLALVMLSNAGIAAGELGMMLASTPDEFALATRWIHVPIFLAFLGIVSFVTDSFGTARKWLGWAVIGSRGFALLLNFLVDPNLNHELVTGLNPVPFLGGTAMTAEAIFSERTRFGEISTLLLLIFVLDASLRLWRKGDSDSRQRARLIGGSVAIFVSAGLLQGVLIHRGVVSMPYLISTPFLIVVSAMAWDMSRDLLRAGNLAEKLREHADSMKLAAEAARITFWHWDIVQDRMWLPTAEMGSKGRAESSIMDLETFISALHPDDRDAVHRAVDAALLGDGDFQADFRVEDESHGVRWIEACGRIEFSNSGKPIQMRGVSIDVSERRQMQERFRLVVEASPNGVVLADAGGKILLASKRSAEMFGYAPGDLLSRSLDDLFPSRRGDTLVMTADERGSPGTLPEGEGYELAAVRKDGSEFPVKIGTAFVDSVEGRLMLSVITDISSHREMEREARRHHDELAHINRVTSLSELSGAIAHEVNQPLTSILTNTQAAQRFLKRPSVDLVEVKLILADIVAEVRRAIDVIQRLRSLLKRGETKRLPVNFNEIVGDVIRLTQADLTSRRVTVTRNSAEALPLVKGDPVQLQQVILNLVLNAADAMSKTTLDSRHLFITTSVEAGHVRVAVRDIGCGLPDNVEKLFDPFFTTKPEGLGMGLAICRSIATAHGGRLRAEDHPQGGAQFFFEVPITS